MHFPWDQSHDTCTVNSMLNWATENSNRWKEMLLWIVFKWSDRRHALFYGLEDTFSIIQQFQCLNLIGRETWMTIQNHPGTTVLYHFTIVTNKTIPHNTTTGIDSSVISDSGHDLSYIRAFHAIIFSCIDGPCSLQTSVFTSRSIQKPVQNLIQRIQNRNETREV